MKLVMLMYLEEDEPCVRRLLRELEVPLFSRMPVEGVGGGATDGWYGEPMPYESRLAFAMVPDPKAADLIEAVEEGRGGLRSRSHPVRAFQLPVEAASACGAHHASRNDE